MAKEVPGYTLVWQRDFETLHVGFNSSNKVVRMSSDLTERIEQTSLDNFIWRAKRDGGIYSRSRSRPCGGGSCSGWWPCWPCWSRSGRSCRGHGRSASHWRITNASEEGCRAEIEVLLGPPGDYTTGDTEFDEERAGASGKPKRTA